MENRNNQDKNKKEECLHCTVSPETLEQIKKAGKGNKKVSENPKFAKKILPIFTLIGGFFSAILGAIGTLGLCSTALISVILGFLGISSVLLMKNNILFLSVGLILMGLSIILFKKQKICKN